MMKNRILVLLLSLFVTGLSAQTPMSTNVSGGKYPALLPDNRVEFRVKAPNAQKIQVDLGKTYDMTKGTDGMWTLITEPQGAGIHYYSLIIDGVSVADPASESFYGCSRMSSCIEIPYPTDVKQYDIQDVPHGDVRTKYYFSNVTDSWRKMYVYTPAGYDTSTEKYPVLYIMHGGGEDARGWIQQGRTDIILDNLIQQGKSKKMLVVCLDANVGNYDNVEKEIMDNIIPFVEKNFRVDAKPTMRALAGLSMGGLYTLHVGVQHCDSFGYLGVFSSGWHVQNPLAGDGKEAQNCYDYLTWNKETFNSNVKLFWLGMGGKEDIAYNNCQVMMKRFDQMGVNYEYHDSNFGGHTWPVWREDIYMFAPRLFR